MSDTSKQPIPVMSLYATGGGADMDVIVLMRRKGDPGLYAANAKIDGNTISSTALRWRDVVVADEQDAELVDSVLPHRSAH
ncbi:hypothetical protein AQ842_05705 [Burkholderia pseudomallei]|uniref:hypothetical protein n=2 Tax=Burkholderia pseudomallei TaxID=28450 RepID=UPI000976CEF1|nr:hypothetical protein [Burkholderia pseudomallei]OMY27881.1 hypothetical protein AQ842_05705 [Burkholderia pseudomallei]